MAQDVGYINPDVAKMYGKSYSELTAREKRILHKDSLRREKLIKERQKAFMNNEKKAFEDEAQLERVLGQIYTNCQKQILADVAETVAKVQKNGGEWSYANQSALTRSRGLFEQINTELQKMGQAENIAFNKTLSHIFTDQFLRTTYTLGQEINVNINLNKINPAYIKATLDYPWSGAMFSDRLWNDKATLGRNLRAGLTQSMVLGEDMNKIADRIGKNIETSRYNAMRVARTETKRVTYVAHDEVMKDCGIEEERLICAVGACSLCTEKRDESGTGIYKVNDPNKPQLPIHPNCKCRYVAEVKDYFGDNELNELTGSIRGAENYEKWVKSQEEATDSRGRSKNRVRRPTKNLDNLNKPPKNDKVGKEDIKLTDYPQPFYSTKAEAKNTQALLDYINSAEGADPKVVSLYKNMDNAYFLDAKGIPFKISHAKDHQLACSIYRSTGEYADVKLVIPKISGDDITGAVNVTLHEEMHFMDMLLADVPIDGTSDWASMRLSKFFTTTDDVIGEEVQELFNTHKKLHDDISVKMRDKFRAEHDKIKQQYLPNGLWGDGADYKAYKKEFSKAERLINEETDYLHRNSMAGVNNLQDIYDALSGGTARDRGYVLYGHGSSYYRSVKSRCHETIANYGALSITRPDLIQLLAKDKPQLVEALDELIDEMLRRVSK